MYQISAVGSVVVFVLASSFLVALCNGACLDREARLSSSGEKPKECMDGDNIRALNSTWFKEDCTKCTCDNDGEIECCSRVPKPIPKDEDCEAVLNKTSCTYSLKRKDNSSKPCEIFALM
ncbi:small serum protein 2-like [Leptodactylus fuscus]|uniref:small serum protein 2-like n=1 Tax=Leptodactylus fuscus TaxID=238119 RepID=UPI003F4EACBD